MLAANIRAFQKKKSYINNNKDPNITTSFDSSPSMLIQPVYTLVNVNAPVVAETSWWLHFSAQVVA